MKKFFTLVIFVLALSNLGFAQEPQAVWDYYQSDADEFSAEFPAQPKVSEISDQKSKKPVGNLYKTYFNKTFYFVVACQTNECLHFEALNGLKFRARNAANSQFTEKSLDEFVTETKFGDAEGFFHTIRRIKTDKFQYLAHSVSEYENSVEAQRFLQSFQLKTAVPDARKFEKEKFDRSLAFEDTAIPLPPQPQPKTSDNPLKPAEPNAPLKTNVVTVPVKILSKPKALYTDLARIYEISGQVYLRVTFTANQSIGAITPFRKLPFGLTEQAIIAAQGMNFEPALRDRVPYTVTKLVIYSFTIY